eukprot:2812109-Amphidinium_carterae.1
MGRHANACCAGPVQKRHNKLRDYWAKLVKNAGWTCLMEQIFPIPSRPNAAPPNGGAPLQHKADIIILSPLGFEFVLISL